MRNIAGAEPMQLLLKEFLVPKKGGGPRPIGLKGTKSASQVVQIQDADKSHSSMPRKLLYINRPLKTHILPFPFTHGTGNSWDSLFFYSHPERLVLWA